MHVLKNERLKDVPRIPDKFSDFHKGCLRFCFRLISTVILSLNTQEIVRALRKLSNSLGPKPRKPLYASVPGLEKDTRPTTGRDELARVT